MSNHSAVVMKKILETYKGSQGLKVVVDVGGGIAATLNLIISEYPHIKGINYDLPHVIEDAPPYPGTTHILLLINQVLLFSLFLSFFLLLLLVDLTGKRIIIFQVWSMLEVICLLAFQVGMPFL